MHLPNHRCSIRTECFIFILNSSQRRANQQFKGIKTSPVFKGTRLPSKARNSMASGLRSYHSLQTSGWQCLGLTDVLRKKQTVVVLVQQPPTHHHDNMMNNRDIQQHFGVGTAPRAKEQTTCPLRWAVLANHLASSTASSCCLSLLHISSCCAP
jgi:hypothetical protein